MSDIETKMIIKFLGKEKKLTLIDDYNKFLEKCYELFKINENEKKNLKIYVVDEDEDNLAIENEDDFKEQRIINNENNTITYILELKGKIESNINNDENNMNNRCINNIDYSKIVDLIKEENKKFKDELIEKINLKIKKVNNRISEVKTFLFTMNEGMNKNNEQLQNTINENKILTQNNNNDKKLEEFKNEIINKVKLLEETTSNFKKEFKNLENKFDRMKEDIRKQNQIQIKKKEKEEFYGCLFEDGNYIFQTYYYDLIQLNPFTINIKLLNNGNVSWPQNSFLNIYSNDNFFQKQEIINKDFEVQPKQNINYNLKIPLNNIKNENYEIKINMNLEFFDKSKFIQQNDFNLKFIIKQSKKEINIPNINQFNNPQNNLINNNFDSNMLFKNKKDNIENTIIIPNLYNNNNNSSTQNFDTSKTFNLSQYIGNEDEIFLDFFFLDIKEKLEENYAISTEDWSDEELKEKIKGYFNNEIKEKLKSNKNEGIKKIVELIGRELLLQKN